MRSRVRGSTNKQTKKWEIIKKGNFATPFVRLAYIILNNTAFTCSAHSKTSIFFLLSDPNTKRVALVPYVHNSQHTQKNELVSFIFFTSLLFFSWQFHFCYSHFTRTTHTFHITYNPFHLCLFLAMLFMIILYVSLTFSIFIMTRFRYSCMYIVLWHFTWALAGRKNKGRETL